MALASIRIPPADVPTVPALEQKLPMDFDLSIPGGTTVSMPASFGPTSECQLIVDYGLPSISLSMAPFGFIFCIANVLIKIKAFADAVPASLGPPPDPTVLTSSLADLATAIACITGAIPTISVPIMIKDLIDYLDALLSCWIGTLTSIQTNLTNLDSAISDAKSGSALDVSLQQAKVQQLALVEQMNVQMKPLQGIFSVMTILLGLAGLGSISFSQPGPGTGVADLITALSTLQGTLATLKATLP